METDSIIKDEFGDINLEGRQPPTVQPTAKALSDGSRDETPVHTYKHRWTVEQRVTLAILGERYTNNWDDITCVFNRCHRSELRKCGGLRKAVVYAQLRDMRKKFNLEAALRNLASRAHLEQKAIEVGVQLEPKSPTDFSYRGGFCDRHRNKRKRDDSSDDSRTDYLPDDLDNGIRTGFDPQTMNCLTLPKTPTKIAGKQEYNGLLTPPDSRDRKIPRFTLEKKLARIGFRAFTSQTQGTYSSALGIRASAFLNCSDIPLAADRSETRYREEAL